MSNNDRITQPQQAIMTDAQMDEVMRVADSKTRPQQYDGYGNEHSYEYEQAGPSRRHEDEISPAPAAGIMTDAQLAEVMAHADQKRGQNTPPLAPPPQRNDAITPIPSQENVNLIRPEDGPVPGPPPAYTFAQDQNPNPVPPVVELIQRKNDIRSPKGTPLTWWEWVQIVARTCTALATLVIVGFVAHQLKREGMIYQPHGTPAYFAVAILAALLDFTFIIITFSPWSALGTFYHVKFPWLFMIIQFFMAGAYNTVIYWVNATSWGYYDQHLWQFWTLLGLAVGHIIYWIIALWMAIKNWRVRRKARKEEEKRMMPQKWDAEIELDIRREEEDDGLRVIRP